MINSNYPNTAEEFNSNLESGKYGISNFWKDFYGLDNEFGTLLGYKKNEELTFFFVPVKGFIEAHHRVPLSEIDGETTTKLKDLALVWPNCHKMLHKAIDTLIVAELKKKIKR